MNPLEAFRRERGLLSGDDLEAWLEAAGLDEREWCRRVAAGEVAGLPGCVRRRPGAAAEAPVPMAAPPPQLWMDRQGACGDAALRVVCRVLGAPAEPSLRQEATLVEIVEGAAAAGLHATPLKVSRRRLDELPVPWIAHVDGEHWIVVHRVEGASVIASDPARGAGRLGRGAFEARWSGWCAVFAPFVQSD